MKKIYYVLLNLSKLENNWYNSDSKAPDKDKLLQFGDLFESYYDKNSPLPAIFPTFDGNIQLEWTISKNEISLEVNLNDFSAEFLSVDVNSDNYKETYFNLNNSNGWQEFNQIIKTLS